MIGSPTLLVIGQVRLPGYGSGCGVESELLLFCVRDPLSVLVVLQIMVVNNTIVTLSRIISYCFRCSYLQRSEHCISA